MDKKRIIDDLVNLFRSCDGNVIAAGKALPGCEGLVMFDEPIFGVSSADDPIYETFKRAEVVGDNFMLPEQWLPGAKSVISFFLPFTQRVRSSNRGDPESTSNEWLHARIEGQAFINSYTEKLKELFAGYGVSTCVPASDSRFATKATMLPPGDPKVIHFSSNWSERHVAYASGLGTFCLTRGLISPKGVAGRYGSIITDAEIAPDERPYTGVYDYCIMCGACVKRCPAGAISLEHGKNQQKCKQWMDITAKKYDPRYGCGKCQVGVPCEGGIPRVGLLNR
ncbi:MAG: 4Fe-4S binding protein [Clostridiales bacterium]|nr:4Fe-4S binding protein [Clostridiales bacterium]